MRTNRRTNIVAGIVALTAAAALGVVGGIALSQGGSDGTGEPRATGSRAPALATRHPLAGGFRKDDTTLASCVAIESGDDEAARQRCREQALGNLAFDKGSQAAFSQLSRRIDGPDDTWQIDAHAITHKIGSATLRRNKDNIGLTFTQGSMVGSAGFYHGVILKALRGADLDRLGATMAEVCADDHVAAVPFLRYQCHHGAGHGLMIYTGYDLPGALDACEQLPTEQFRFDCKTGVFMENYAEFLGVGVPGFNSPWIRTDDLLFPCNAVDSDDQLPCYVQVVDRIGPGVKWNWERVAHTCRTIRPIEFRANCFDSYGLWANHWAQGQANEVYPLCRRAGPEETQCLYGAARAMINADLSKPAMQRQVAGFCDAAPMRARERCFYGAGTVLQQLGGPQHRVACQRMTSVSTYRSACQRGTGPGKQPL